MGKIRLSLVINTKNEINNLENCIKSVGSLANEIIVVDMQSIDGTVELSKKLGAQVFYHLDTGFVESARQYAINKAKGDWILLLDADESLSFDLRKQISELIQDKTKKIIAIPRKNIIFEQWIKGAGYWPNYQIRLFTKGALTWPAEIHAEPKVKYSVFKLPVLEANAIVHSVYVNPETILTKTETYSTYDKSFERFLEKADFSAENILNYIAWGFNSFYLEQGGYQDNFRGYILSKMMEIYRFCEVVKFWMKHQKLEINHADMLNILSEQKEFQDSRTFLFWKKLRVIKKKLTFFGFNH